VRGSALSSPSSLRFSIFLVIQTRKLKKPVQGPSAYEDGTGKSVTSGVFLVVKTRPSAEIKCKNNHVLFSKRLRGNMPVQYVQKHSHLLQVLDLVNRNRTELQPPDTFLGL